MGEITRPAGGNHRLSKCLNLRLCRLLEAVQPGHDPLDVRIDGGGFLAEGNRGDRGGRVSADPRQLAKLSRGRWKGAAACDFTGAGDQVPRAGVISEAGPLRENVLVARSGERHDRRPAGDEALKPRSDRRDRGLLQHDLAQPHPVGIGTRAGRRSPR